MYNNMIHRALQSTTEPYSSPSIHSNHYTMIYTMCPQRLTNNVVQELLLTVITTTSVPTPGVGHHAYAYCVYNYSTIN